MMLAVYILSGICGLYCGSFLNVVIQRLPRDLPLTKPSIACASCGCGLRWQIPVLSHLLLGGKCPNCKAPIPLRYIAVELLNGGLWALAALVYLKTAPLYSLAVMLFCSLMLCIGFIDLDTMYIHDILVYLLAVPVGLACMAAPDTLLARLLGIAAGGGSFLAVWLLFRLVAKKEGMGLGDVMLMAFIGAFLGWQGTVFSIFLASILGCLILVPRQCLSKADTEYPFAPFLTGGAVAAVFLAEPGISWYLGLFSLG